MEIVCLLIEELYCFIESEMIRGRAERKSEEEMFNRAHAVANAEPTVCPRSSYPFYIGNYYINLVTT